MYQEGIYENEHGSTLVDIEAQALITYLGGGLIGHIFGSCPLWNFGTTRSFCDTANSTIRLIRLCKLVLAPAAALLFWS